MIEHILVKESFGSTRIGRGNCLINLENNNNNGNVVFSIIHREIHTKTCWQEIMKLGPDVPFNIGAIIYA